MIIRLDAHIPRSAALWIEEVCGIEAATTYQVGLRSDDVIDIYRAARNAEAVSLSKDSDFVDLITRMGAPPRLLWLTCRNASKSE